MKIFYLALAGYLMYDTFKYGRQVWEDGNKLAGFVLVLLSFSFPVLFVLLINVPT